MIAIHLVLLAGMISLAASRILPQARWAYQAPGLGLAAWYTVLATVVMSSLGAVAFLVARWPATQKTICAWWAICVDLLTGGFGPAGRAAGATALAAGVTAAVPAIRRLARAVRDTAQALRCHRDTLTLIGRHDPWLGATVVDDPRPAAYALPGRRHHIVITTGALTSLPRPQVAAVLAHERAHCRQHHHLLLTAARVLAQSFPSMGLFRDAHRQIDRLVELHADDIAVRIHDPLDLARALVTCAEAAACPTLTPLPAMAAAAHGGDALERVQRLLTPPPPLSRHTRLAISATLIALITAPLMITVLGTALPTLGVCLPIGN